MRNERRRFALDSIHQNLTFEIDQQGEGHLSNKNEDVFSFTNYNFFYTFSHFLFKCSTFDRITLLNSV